MNEREPLVAVVTPVYNGGELFARTMACVQAQTYENILYVVLDNASTDVTSKIIADNLKGPKRIITRRNASVLPQTDNWNAAMAMVPKEARYVKFLAADDLMREDCVEKMVALAESDPEIDFVHAIDVFNGWTKPHGLDPSRSIYDGREYGRFHAIGRVTWISSTHMFFRARPELLVEPFSKTIYPLMDEEFIFRCLLDRKMGFIFEPLIFTRYTAGTVTRSLGGFTSYIMPTYQIILRYGRRFLGDQEFAQISRATHLKVARHYLISRLTDTRVKKGIESGMAQECLSFTLADYIEAVLDWPLHKLKAWRAAIRSNAEPTAAVPESAFVA